jgi:dipeptidyl-peptidase-4
MRTTALLALLCAAAMPAAAQQPRVLTTDDYARAERFMGYNTNPLVSGGSVRPTWLPDERFWYRNQIAEGAEFVLVDPAHRTRGRAFDHAKIAAALSHAADTTYDAFHLPFNSFDFSADGQSISFDARARRFTCDLQGTQCTAAAGGAGGGRRRAQALANAVVSPDSAKAAFIRDYNLWVRDLASGRETQLTTDGVRDFGYATDNAGWTRSERAVVVWSPDSRKIATFQQDERGVGEMYLVQTQVGHPALEQWKYPLPGDSVITTIQRVIVELDGPRVIRLQMPPDQHRSTDCDHIVCGGRWADVEWNADGSQLIFVSTARDHRHEWMRVADARTGAVRDVFDETDSTFLQSGFSRSNWRALPASNEVIWYSERSNWGHLYLYDLATGRLKNAITHGDWNVLEVRRVDERTRTVYFTGVGREPGDPYFRHFYSVRMDGTHLTLLTPEDADHDVVLSSSGRWFVDDYSRPDVAPISMVKDMEGRTLLTAEHADISRLALTGWKPPMPITMKARDGQTNIYGLLYRPTNFDSTRHYPIVNHIYPGPQAGSVGGRSFSAARGDAQALAELGFVVVEIDAMGTPLRSHSFQSAYYGNMGDNGLPDQVAAMRELGQRYHWIDLDCAGIYGHSGGGFAAADAILRYPDFFKVAISEAGNHDQREYEDDWGEKWQGLLDRHRDGTTTYDNQANQLQAHNLRGKLLLAHGTTDNNVPPYNTLLLINELIRANKDFDLLMLPNRRHGFGAEPYMVRRRWDYFVTNLMGAVPPHEYEMHPPAGPGAGRPVQAVGP